MFAILNRSLLRLRLAQIKGILEAEQAPYTGLYRIAGYFVRAVIGIQFRICCWSFISDFENKSI